MPRVPTVFKFALLIETNYYDNKKSCNYRFGSPYTNRE
jgi:hypothetical protein